MLTLYLATLIQLFISSRRSFINYLGFSAQKITLSSKAEFLPFLPRTSGTVLKSSGEKRHSPLCSWPYWESFEFYTLKYDVSYRFLVGILQIEEIPLYSQLIEIFLINQRWILSNDFPASTDVIMWFLLLLQPVDVMDYINWFQMLNQPCEPEGRPC